MSKTRRVLVIARSNAAEAMRVASGATVFGHEVFLVFAHGNLEITPQIEELAELLDLADIEPKSLLDDPEVTKITAQEMGELLVNAECIINV